MSRARSGGCPFSPADAAASGHQAFRQPCAQRKAAQPSPGRSNQRLHGTIPFYARRLKECTPGKDSPAFPCEDFNLRKKAPQKEAAPSNKRPPVPASSPSGDDGQAQCVCCFPSASPSMNARTCRVYSSGAVTSDLACSAPGISSSFLGPASRAYMIRACSGMMKVSASP